MTRPWTAAVLVLFVALPAFAQLPSSMDEEKIVAIVNGEPISRETLDSTWSGLTEEMREQYEETGSGRLGVLETIVQKRLMLQDAVAKGYDQWPEITAADASEREDALFDLLVRETIVPRVITDEAIEDFYAKNPERFSRPARARVRILAISTARRMDNEARQMLSQIQAELFALRRPAEASGDSSIIVQGFADAAARFSEHPSRENGGDLGWVNPADLDGNLRLAAERVPEGSVSGVLQIAGGFALVLVEKRQEAQQIELDAARDAIHSHLTSAMRAEIIAAAGERSRQLREQAEVRVFPENLQ